MKRHSVSKLARCRLLAGIPLALLALPAAAQVRATGDQILTNDQRTQGTIRADVAGSRVAVLVRDPAESRIALDDNEIRAAVTGNLGAFELSSDHAGPFDGSPSLASDADGVEAHAGQVIASRQRLGSGDVSSETPGAAVRLDAAKLSASELSLRDNATATISRGNSSDATIKGRDFGSAGIAIRQETGSGSRVLATTAGGFEVAIGDLGSSRLDMVGNRAEAIARGNGTRNRLDASGVVIGGTSDAGSMSGEEQAHLHAPAAILTDQNLAGSVWARAGGILDRPAFSVQAADVTSGSIVVAANALVADAQGNGGSNRLALASPVLDHAPPSEGSSESSVLAGILNVQRADGASVGAGTTGGVAVRVRRLDTATVGVDNNETVASAVRNIASNALVVRGTLIEAGLGAASERADDIRTSGALTLQNVQDYGAGPRGYATVSAPGAAISIGGPVRDAQLRASGNGATATVAGNEAANDMAIDATTLSAGVALHSVQYGSGSLAAFNGMAPEPAGIRIEVGGAVDRSTLDLSSNRDLARASANHATNELAVSAARIEGSGEATSTATHGVADLLIESDQWLGAAGLPVPQILAYGATRTGAEIAGQVSDSRLVIADNEALAEASGNSVSNRLAVDGAHADQAGLLLAARQEGNAELVAHSQVAIAMPGWLTGSSLSVDANRNTAVASTNSAENLLVAEGQENADASKLGSGFGQPVSASKLLVNRQEARGSIDANARTMLEIAGPVSLGGAHWSFTDNQVRAEAVANRAINTLAGAGIAGGGLVSEQQSSASVTATSAITLHRSATPGTAASSSDIGVTGNRAEAIARGNVADNLIESSDRAGSVALRNSQANSGSIYAAANGAGFASPLNGTAPATDTRLAIRGNAIVADAAGNMAVSRIAQAVPGQAPVTVTSMQVNSGDVRASAVGAGAFAPLGSLQGAVLQLSGNSISANAVGNQATSVITGLR